MSALARKVAAVVPCKNEADRVATTVDAVRSLPQVGRVVVVDDGSTDDTSRAAEAAGAVVVRHGRNRGKAAALETGVRRVRELEGAEAAVDADAAWPAALLFVDGDLQETASNLGVLAAAVLDGAADMTIATLPAQLTAGEVPSQPQRGAGGPGGRGPRPRARQYRDVWLALVRRGWRPWHRG